MLEQSTTADGQQIQAWRSDATLQSNGEIGAPESEAQ